MKSSDIVHDFPKPGEIYMRSAQAYKPQPTYRLSFETFPLTTESDY